MKRFCAILSALVLCFVLTVPAFAVNHNGIEFPDPATVWTDKDKYSSACVYLSTDGFYQLVLSAGPFDGSKSSGLVCRGLHAFYTFDENGSSWTLDWEMDNALEYPLSEYIWSSDPILDTSGNVIFESHLAEAVPVLPSVVSGGSLIGVLGEVTSLLIWVIPAVIGFFAVRKGVAFLIARVKGV